MKRFIARVFNFFSLLILFISIMLFFTQYWLLNTWAELSADEVIYHLRSSLSGTNVDMVKEALLRYALPGIILFSALSAGLILVSRKKPKLEKYLFSGCFLAGAAIIALSCVRIEKNMGIFSYVYNARTMGDGKDFIEENYVDPAELQLVFPEKKRNLIYIFLESMEVTYAGKEDGGSFEEGCIPELVELARENENFAGEETGLNGGIVLPGCTWTMGAMFAHSSGLPLQIPIAANGMGGRDSFFEGTVTLGDILKDQGYNETLLIGSKASFGGRDHYYAQHGDFAIHDYSWAVETGLIPEDYYVWWGYEDEKLFEYAKEELKRLSSGEEPFNLTMLTVDTHFSDGYVCGLCGTEHGGNQYANVMACSSRQVSAFIDWVKEQDFYDNTTIILVGDHLTMDSDFCEDVDEDYNRKVYFSLINSGTDQKSRAWREFSTLDLFPTTLAALNVEIPGNQLGLGVNLFSEKPTLVEKLGVSECRKGLSAPSAFMMEKSGLVITEKDLDKVKKKTRLAADDNWRGKIALTWSNIRYINMSNVQAAYAEVTDNATGETWEYEAGWELEMQDRDMYTIKVDTDVPSDKLNNVTVRFYFTVEGIEHYLVYEKNLAEES